MKTRMAWMALTMWCGAVMAATAGESVFRDDFNEAFVGNQWEVVNADPDSMIVEEGMLQIVTEVPEKKLFNARNMLFYKGELPKEYEAEARVLMTQVEGSCEYWNNAPFVGVILKQDDDNAIVLVAGKSPDRCGSSKDAVIFMRVKNGKWQPGFWRHVGHQQADRPVRLMLRRKGRELFGYYEAVDNKGKPYWRQVGVFPLIKAKGYKVGIIAARGGGNTHEQLDKVDWFELRKLK